jgi:protein-S-isoprenylcysteine O-methyltransferase Ste14
MMTSAALLLIGTTIAYYWFRVLQMAMKVRLRTGRAANLLPPEPLGRAVRLLWGPAVVVWVSHPFVSAFLKHPSLLMRPLWRVPTTASAALAWAAAITCLGCLWATIVCWKRMGRSWRMGIDPREKTPLVATGPFAYVRHPIYALSALMMMAVALALPSPLMVAAALVHVGLLCWESTREEQHLLRTHGASYAAYRTSVGRFLPMSLHPYQGKD